MKRSNRRMNASMMEMICMLGIFGIVSACVLRLFLGAKSLENKAEDITRACIEAQTVGEVIKAESTMEEAVKQLKLKQVQNNFTTSVYEKYYNASWKEVKKAGRYRMVVTVEEQHSVGHIFYTVDIEVRNEVDYPVIKEEEGRILTKIRVCSYK